MKIHFTRLLTAAALATMALALGACTTTSTDPSRGSFAFVPNVKKPSNPSNIAIKLSTGAQVLYVVEGNEVLLASPVSVGTKATPTPHGHFKIRAKTAQRRRYSSPGAGYPLFFWMEFASAAYGIHWGFVKPYPCTHGCVRMPLQSARATFDMIKVGTPVHVATSQPWDDTIGKSLPKLDDSPLPNPPMSYLMSPKAFQDANQGKFWNY